MLNEVTYYMQLPYKMEVTFISEEKGGGVIVELPELGRMCANGWGKTFEEACACLNNVKQDLFEDWIEKGVDIPEPEKKEDYSGKFVLRTSPTLHKLLAKEAKRRCISQNTLIISLLEKGLAEDHIYETLESMLNKQAFVIKNMVNTANMLLPTYSDRDFSCLSEQTYQTA